jgi:hypothetical protein
MLVEFFCEISPFEKPPSPQRFVRDALWRKSFAVVLDSANLRIDIKNESFLDKSENVRVLDTGGKCNRMINLGVKFMGIDFKTPFLLASGPATTAVGEISRHCRKIAENAWAGIITKTVISKYGQYKRPHLWSSKHLRFLGMTNSGPPMSE